MTLYSAVNRGLAEYHRARYFEAHEIWEDAWLGEVGRTKIALQALIQLAAGLYKHQTGVPRGTSKLLARAAETIAGVTNGASAWLGIDFVGLSAAVGRALVAADRIARGEAGVELEVPDLPTSTGPDGILYLHGFASSPGSKKARAIAGPLAREGYHVAVPDQNEGDFRGLAISRVLALAKRSLRDRTLVIGSSLGGYVATLLAAADDRVKALVLMAPAFDFAARLEARHGEEAIRAWAADGAIEVHHYGDGEKRPIGYGLLEDARLHAPFPPIRVPAFILHGRRDETIPVSVAKEAKRRFPDAIELAIADDVHDLAGSAPIALAAAHRLIGRLGLEKEPER